MDDPLISVTHGEEPDPELGAIGRQHFHLAGRNGIAEGLVQGRGGDVVVHGGDGQVGSAHLTAGQPQPVEGLGRCHLVHQMKVDVQQVGLAFARTDDMALPYFFGEGRR